MGGGPLTPPPEGVVSGENIPRENEEEEINEKKLREMVVILKSHGEPYKSMSDSELEEKAIEIIERTS